VTDFRLTWSTRIYRRVLQLLPLSFRRQYAHQMLDVFAEVDAEARRAAGARGALGALASELPGVVRLALRERRFERANRRTSVSPSTSHTPMFSAVWQDIRFAARSVRRNRGFAFVTVMTLALGVGANTAIFSAVNGVLLRPLPVREPPRLVALGESSPTGGFSVTTPANLYDWQRSSSTLGIAGYSGALRTLVWKSEPRVVQGMTSIGGVLGVLGVRPLIGRSLTVADEEPASPQVIVLSYALWRDLYGEDRSAIGQTLTLDRTAFTIVGVLPPEFSSFLGERSDFVIPSKFDAAFKANRDQGFIQVVGRLRDGVSLDQARAELASIAARIRRDWPQYNSNLLIVAFPLRDIIVGDVRTQLLVLMGAVAFVLLITCANLGNLLLARGSARRREIAVRQALGAGQGRIAGQLLTESLLLALAGGAVGLLLGKLFLELLIAGQAFTNLPRVDEIALDRGVLAFTLGISVLAGLIFGTIPAWQLARARSADALRQGTRGSAGHRWMRSALVVSELALAMMLLTGAGLLLRSFDLLRRVNPGVRPDHVMTFSVRFTDRKQSTYLAALERIRVMPGVASAALVSQIPITGRGIGAWFNSVDKPLPPDVKPAGEAYRVVTPEFFRTVGISLRRGRLLETTDRLEAPVVVINEALARKYYHNESPLGRQIYLGAPDNRLFKQGTIVGVVADTRDAGLASDPLPTVYIPAAVMPDWTYFSYVVHAEGDPASVVSGARTIIRELDPGAPLRSVSSMDDVVAAAVAPARWSTTLFGVFAALALAIAVFGVFGVLSFVVAQRTKELGIRIALGASSRQVRALVVRSALLLVVSGAALGLLGAMILTRFMTTLLYGIAPTDPVTYAGVAVVLGMSALVASYLPARRATRVDPIVALRAE
jgi:putative ABC transport system permease protein